MHILNTFWRARSWPNKFTIVIAGLAFMAIAFITALMLLAAGHAPKSHLEAVLIRGALEVEFLVTTVTWVAANLVWTGAKVVRSACRYIRKSLKFVPSPGIAKPLAH
ncbi:MAG TPA: hypothetical protein VGG10_20890 [Rhizomicrobium sp.]|jgi:uncharacterized membrane protein